MKPTFPAGRQHRGLQFPGFELIWLIASLSASRITAQTNLPPHHFSWNSLPPVSQSGLPFSALVQARDLDGNIVTNFNGGVALTELIPVEIPKLLIGEVQTVNTQRVELANMAGNPVDVSGWRVVIYDRLSWPTPKVTFILPMGTVCPGFGIFQVRGSGSPPGAFPVFNTGVSLAWTSSSANNQVAVLLLDSIGNVVDFFCAVDAYPAFITVPTTITDTYWNGPPAAPNSNAALTFQRGGHSDYNNAADWAAPTNSFGTLNSCLQTPFVAAPFQYPLAPSSVTLTNGEWSGQLTVTTPGTNVILRADDLNGHAGDSAPLTVLGLPMLELQTPTEAFKATPGLTGLGSVEVPQTLSSNLVVTLSCSLPNSIVLPPSVTIPAGATNAVFAVTNLDNGLVEGPQVAKLLATASGFAAGTTTITNHDLPTTVLTVSLPASVVETSGWLASGQVRSSLPVSGNVAVRLTSSNPNKLLVQEVAIIPAGKTNGSFGFAVLDNPLIDGNQTVTINATVPGWPSAQTQILVVDNETTNLTLTLPIQANEGATLTNGSVQISGLATTNVTVVLTSDFPAKLEVPTSVLIPAGQTSAVFSVTIAEDLVSETNTVARVTASAEGFRSATRSLTVIDNDAFSFAIVSLPAAQLAGQPFQVTVHALNKSGNVAPGYSGSINLQASGFLGSAVVSPTSLGPFTNGVWSGQVTVPSPNRGLALSVSDGLGHVSSTTPFDVVAALILNLPVADLVYDFLRDKLLAGVVTNALGNGQSVIAIDPVSGGLDTPIFIGADPSKLALADDCSYLYVSQEINSTGGVVRVDLNTQSVDLRFPVGTVNIYGQVVNYIEDMKVLPGFPHTLVATTKIQYSYNQYIGVYDNGVRRPDVVTPVYYVRTYHSAFADSASFFYVTKPNGLWINSITPSGASFVREIAGPQYGADVVFSGGRLYSASGLVFNTNDFQTVGTYPASGLVIPDPANARVYFLTQAGTGTTFRSFERDTFLPIAQLDLPNVSGEATAFVQCGANRFAFRTSGNQLHIFDTSLLYTNSIANLGVKVETSPDQPVLGSTLVYSITVSNAGPATSFGAVLTNQIPPWSSFVSATSTMGTWGQSNGVISASLGLMTNGAVAELTITVRPVAGGAHLNLARASALSFDPDQSDNVVTKVQTVLADTTNSAVTLISLPSNDIVFDPATERIWASIPAAAFGLSNCLASLDPVNGRIESLVPVGRGPSQLAIPPTGQHLYVGLDGDSRVQRFDTISQALSPSFFIGTNIGAYHMDVRPGASQTVAVARYSLLTGVGTGVALYDNGVQRPLTIGTGRVQFSTDGSQLYKSDGAGGSFSINNVVGDGLTVTGGVALDYHFPAEMSVAGQQAYYGSGYVVDFMAGSYAQQFSPIGYAAIACVDEPASRIFFVWSDSQNWFLEQYGLYSHALEASLALPPLLADPQDLIRWGSNGLAFRNSSNQLFLVQIPFMTRVPQLSVEQSASPLIGSVGSNMTYTIIVTNHGTADAHNVILTDTFPGGATFVSAFSPQGTITQSATTVTFALGTISNRTTVPLQLVVAPTVAGWNTNTCGVAADLSDSSSGQNVSSLSHWLNLGSVQPLINRVNLQAVWDIAFDSSSQTILASITATGREYSNSIIGLDPWDGSVVLQIPVGDQPGPLALSDDNQYLYTGLTTTGGVARINLASNINDLTFGLGVNDGPKVWAAGDMKVIPGQPRSVAVSVMFGQSNEGVAIYDDNVRRTNTSPGREFGGAYPYFISFGSDASTLYSALPFYFRTIAVDEGGATLVDETTGLVPGYDAAFEFDAGRIYFQAGRVIDPINKTIVGAFPAAGPVAPDSANDRIYFVTSTGSAPFNWQLTLRAFDLGTSNELWSVPFPIASGGAKRLVKCGTNGLAVLTDAHRLFLVRTPQLSTPTSDLTISAAASPSPVSAGAPLAYTLNVQNHGPWLASEVVVSNWIPPGANFVSASSSRGACTFSNGSVLCTLGSLSNTASATVTITVTASAGVVMTNFSTVTQNEYDPNLTNNAAVVITAINPQPSVSIGDVTVLEGTGPGNSSISFTLTLSGPSSTNVTVGYQTTDGSAIAGQDYNSASGVVSFAPGNTSRPLSLSIIRSSPSIAPSSFFYLNLASPTNVTIARTQAVATIVNRVFRTVSIAGGSLAEGNSGFTNAIFKLMLSATSGVPVNVQYETASGTAFAGADFLPKAGALVFAPGVTNVTLAVPVIGNTAWSPDKTFSVQISQPENAVIAVNEAVQTIVNDDPVPALAILNPPISQTVTQGATATFTVVAIGNPLPLSYQWQFNGYNISGATNSTLNLTNIQWSDDGNYAVNIANAGGSSTNQSAGLRVLARLNAGLAGNRLTLTWTGPFTLQLATNVTGPYLDFPSASSPYTNLIGDEPNRFFRLRSVPTNDVSSMSIWMK